MNNISNISDCFGCGVCALACAKKIIDLRLNEDGFYQPVIAEQEKCTNCGLCLDVCSFNKKDLALASGTVKAYAAWSNDFDIRKSCSSGGIGYEIGRSLINDGFKVCSVRYNVQEARAEHYIATTVEELSQGIGSKYLQSYTVTGFKGISIKGNKYLVVGTPCQIDSFRRFIKRYNCEDNYVLVDFFCHGVPSYLLWKKYLSEHENTLGRIVSASWRNKTRNKESDSCDWHDSWDIHIQGDKGLFQSKLSEGDLFYRFFIGNYCLNNCCYNDCRFKHVSSSADIRLGDCWGKKYAKDKKGVSTVIALTDLGAKVLGQLNTCEFVEEGLECVTEGQYKKPVSKPFIRSKVIKMLRSKPSLKTIHTIMCKPYMLMNVPKRVVRKLIKK